MRTALRGKPNIYNHLQKKVWTLSFEKHTWNIIYILLLLSLTAVIYLFLNGKEISGSYFFQAIYETVK